MQHIETVFTVAMQTRGKCCRKIMQAASKSDVWTMHRFQYINRYLAELPQPS